MRAAYLDEGIETLIRAFATSAYPNEGCGVLVGKMTPDSVIVVDVTIARNLWTERARDRYDMDPGDIHRTERDARSRGLDVVGFWHSHPDHPAQPSGFDTDRAWVDYLYIICQTTTNGSGDIGGFMLEREGGGFVAVAMGSPDAVRS